MISTTYLATAMGLFAVLQGASRLIRREAVLAMFRELAKNGALTYVVGTVLTMFGAALVIGHTVFRDWQTTIVSLFGWGVLLDGCRYLFLPANFIERSLKPLERPGPYFATAIGFLILGIVLVVSVI